MIISNVLGDSIGEIELVDSMGSDLSVVNSARISYGGESEEMTTQDEKLVNYLAKNNHSSPFRHAFISTLMKVLAFYCPLVLLPDPLQMDQCPLSFTENQMLKARKGQKLMFREHRLLL